VSRRGQLQRERQTGTGRWIGAHARKVLAGQYLHGHDLFLKRVGGAYNAFIESTERDVRNKCKEDLLSTTRYITWSLHTRNGCGLKGMLGDVRSNLQRSLLAFPCLTRGCWSVPPHIAE
jgi:hypothetical protein